MQTTILPPNVAALAELAAKQDTKYAITGVRLKVNEDGTYVAAATDTRVLGKVTGKVDLDVKEMPEIPGMAAAPNGECEALVPAKVWKKALKPTKLGLKLAKGNGKSKGRKFAEQTAVVIGKDVVTFGGTDTEESRLEQARQLAGKFPPVDDIIPKPKAAGAMVVDVDAELLIKVLKAALAFVESGSSRVTVEVRGTKPMVVRSQNGTQEFTGLVMPLS